MTSKKLAGKCPVCGSPAPLKPLFGPVIRQTHMDWRKHVVKMALHEAWLTATQTAPEGEHVRFYIVHSKPAGAGKRTWTL